MDKKQITAAEAKHLADTSEVVKRRVFKCISEAASEGMLSTYYGINNPSMVLVKAIESDLIAKGFEVSIIPEEDASFVSLTISWSK